MERKQQEYRFSYKVDGQRFYMEIEARYMDEAHRFGKEAALKLDPEAHCFLTEPMEY